MTESKLGRKGGSGEKSINNKRKGRKGDKDRETRPLF